MRTSRIAVGLAAATVLAIAAPALAQSSPQGTTFTSRDETGRTRTKIIVQKRSYLDGGTEVLPGERKFQDYAFPPGYSPTQVIDNTAMNRQSQTLPGAFDLPSKNNPIGFTPR